MAKRPTIQQLIANYGDAAALERLQSLGEQAVPVLIQAYTAPDLPDFLQAQWYNRILAVTADDPFRVTLELLPQVSASRIALELAWPLRRFVGPADRERLLEALRRTVSFAPANATITLAEGGNTGPAAVLSEGLGLAGQPEDMALLGLVLRTARRNLERCRREGPFSYNLAAEEYLPLIAAAAAALLAISERAGLANGSHRGPWRRAAVEAAVAVNARGNSLGGLHAPMPFLFARAPHEAARVLRQAAEKAEQVDPLLSDIRYWLLVGRELGVPGPAFSPDELAWLDRLGQRASPDSYGPGCALEIRSFLHLAGTLAQLLEQFTRPTLNLGHLGRGSDILRRETPFVEIAAIAVEAYLVACSTSKDGLEAAPEVREELRDLLKGAGLPQIRGWSWAAPERPPAPLDTLQELQQTLCAIASRCRQAARAAAADDVPLLLAPFSELLPHALLRHAFCRSLLLAWRRARAGARPALLTALEFLRHEQDPLMVRAVAQMAHDLLGTRAGPVYRLLLDTPALRKDPAVAERVVQALSHAPTPDTGAAILAFGHEAGWDGAGGGFRLNLALTVAMGRLRVVEAVPVLARRIGQSALGSETELALLQIAAHDPRALDEPTFQRTFVAAMEDGYADYTPDLLGEQLWAHVLRVLEEEPLAAPLLWQVCRFLSSVGSEMAPPPRALPLLLRRLPEALVQAKANPGQEWEDRNWGGYNMTGEELTAELIGDAIETLARACYSRQGWRELIEALLPELDLTRVEMAKSEAMGFSYPWKNLWKALQAGLARLGDAGIDSAAAQSPLALALVEVRRLL